MLIDQMEQRIGVPASVRGTFAGTAQAFQKSLSTEPLLILTALLAIYIVLGMLYESLVHPITILTTLPSASVGAIIALILFHSELDVISIIGIFLLIGIVKKNAIMMIDFALIAEREHGKNTRDAIFEACMLRFRPILMTTMAALFGALPLAFGTGTGSELRSPLGVAIAGGLLFSQVLTLYTTPIIYLYFDRLSNRFKRRRPDAASRLPPRATKLRRHTTCSTAKSIAGRCLAQHVAGTDVRRRDEHEGHPGLGRGLWSAVPRDSVLLRLVPSTPCCAKFSHPSG